MSTTTNTTRGEVGRVLLAKKDLYQSGNSLSVSIPEDTLENAPLVVGDHGNVFSNPDERELVITADTKRWRERGGRARGSRKIRESSHGTILFSIPPKALLEDFGYESVDAAKGTEVRITFDPFDRDFFFEFPD